MLVKAGRYEFIKLNRNHRKSHTARTKHAQFDIGEKLFQKMGGNQLGIIRADNIHERPGQNIVNLVAEIKTSAKRHKKSHHRLDEPRTQLNNMVHQRRFAGVNV